MSLEDIPAESRDEMALLSYDLSNDPETREEFLRLAAKKRKMSMPELEVKDYTRKKVSEAEERVAQLEAKLMEKQALEDLESRRNRLIKKGLVDSEEDIPEIEKIMLEKKIGDHETAAEYFNWMKQAAVPTGNQSIGYKPSPLQGFNLNEYWKNPVQGARNEAAKALAELRKNNRPIGI